MTRRFVFVGAAMAAALSLNLAAFASANDYLFEPKPITDAVIVQTRIDMAPDGMAEMASGLTQPGVYSFKTELPMPGRWLLSVAAKVQGEPETVIGKITFRATR